MTLPSLDLFTGIGGFTLALSCWATPVAYCDNNAGVVATLGSLVAIVADKSPMLRRVQNAEITPVDNPNHWVKGEGGGQTCIYSEL